MKKFLTALTIALLASCSLLDEKNTSYPTADDYYISAEHLHTALNGLYDPARSIYGATFFQLSECATDIIFLSSNSRPDANCIVSPTKPGHGATVWKHSYVGIMRANEVLELSKSALDKEYIDQEEYHAIAGEALVMQAFYYYVLTSVFGDVPFYTCRVTEENRAEIAHLGRTSATEIRDQLIDGLFRALLPVSRGGREWLPLQRSYSTGTDYHAGAALGLTVALKFCMWNHRWDDALTAVATLEDIYGHYADNPAAFGTDYPLTDIPFSVKWTRESIFEISNRVEPYGQQNYYALGSYVTPTHTASQEDDDLQEAASDPASDVYDGLAVPAFGKYIRTYKAARPNNYFCRELMPYDSKDLRSGEYSAGATEPRGGSGNLAWAWPGYKADDVLRTEEKVLPFGSCANASGGVDKSKRPWLGNKFWCPGMYYNRDSNNPKVFRFAGVLLNAAEAQLMKGDLEQACKYLSIIKTRAGLDAVTAEEWSYNSDDIMEEIRRECARELFGEFQRKFDLVRWGIWYERTLRYSNSGYLYQYIRPYHEYYPIPQDQVNYSEGALDNKAYEE